ncbi:polyketide synthase protein [Rutstroemia sp. NJR-2017a BBW]|nr:polyketide synthase protein [Rutstroemia sp. NJR-2017a BBW]
MEGTDSGMDSLPCAIVGLAFEFPQDATSVEAFWQMLCGGRSASTEFPTNRLNIDAFYHPDDNRPSSIPLRCGNFVTEDLASFDAPFFSITPAEAACMDPQQLAQSFEGGAYDLVVASHVLHATDDVHQSLSNIHKLLKPGGKLLLFETTVPETIPIGFVFGLLKGWWSPLDHEPRSTHSPCLTVEQWHQNLQNAGFSGVDVEISGQEEISCRYSSIIITTAIQCNPAADEEISREVALVVDRKFQVQSSAGAALKQAFLSTVFDKSCIYTLAELAAKEKHEQAITVFLLELDAIFLDGISEADYSLIQSILTRSKTYLWVTRAIAGDLEPRNHLAEGVGRVLMSENSTRKFATLSLEKTSGQDDQGMIPVIVNVVNRVAHSSVEDLETNYSASSDGLLYTQRIVPITVMDNTIAHKIKPRQNVECQLSANTQLQLQIKSPGRLESVQWVESEERLELSFLAEDEVLVEGQLNELCLGTDAAGVVRAAGDKSGFHNGDAVCLIGSAAARSVVRAKADAVRRIPPGMNFVEAASIPSAAWLSCHALVVVARLQRGETVLVCQGASSVGQMAIQLAKYLGAVIIQCGTTDQAPTLRDMILATQGQGVDVILGPLLDTSGSDLADYLAPFGRIVDINLNHTTDRTQLFTQREPTTATALNTSRASVDMIDLLNKKPRMAQKTFQEAIKFLFEDAKLKPSQSLQVMGPDEVIAAFGPNYTTWDQKVIELKPGTTLKANIRTTASYSFAADATYVIAGGLGGLGRIIAQWMAKRGAKNLMLLSRSGAVSPAAKALVTELQMQGVTVVTPKLDISHLNNLKHTLEIYAKSMPPIRGCIQATVALRDNIFKNMSYEDWTISTKSKVIGSWNLHAALGQNLDFFVLLSSLNGIFGGRAQANYAAGNTFKDALAHYRLSRGQKAVSIDLGLMATAGVVAENRSLLDSMRRIGHLMDIEQNELLAVLDYYCNPDLGCLSREEAQILVGIEMPHAILSKGIDLHHSIQRPIFRHLFRMSSGKTGTSSLNTQNLVVVDRAAALRKTTDDEATTLVTSWFSHKICQVLGLVESDIDTGKPLHTHGIDSLIAIDLKNWLAREIGANIDVFMLMGNDPMEAISAESAKRSRFR